MNTINILAVADAIEQHTIPELGFNMGHYRSVALLTDHTGHDCETTACIGGWAHALMGIKWGTRYEAQNWLGVDDLVAGQLFYAANYPVDKQIDDWFIQIPADQAVRTLRHLAATGQVDWTV